MYTKKEERMNPMQLSSLYNRLGNLIQRRSKTEKLLNIVIDTEDGENSGKKIELEKQFKHLSAEIENLNSEIEIKENECLNQY